MEIVCIFGGRNEEEGLYAVRYEKEGPDEFTRLFRLWDDLAYVREFCEIHYDDLQSSFRRHLSLEECVQEIIDEAAQMEDQLHDHCNANGLQELFKPLSNYEYVLYPLQKSKACIRSIVFRRPRIRIYAIRLAPNLFIITGGAIKLTATMQERPHLKEELSKLERVKTWLKENELDIPESLN